MTRPIIAALLIAGSLAATSAAAQSGQWTLTECIDYALEHNITVRQSAITVEQKEVELNTAQARRLPGVSASATENLSFGRGLTADNTYTNSNTTSTSFMLGGEIPIFQGFDINNGIKIGRLDLAASTADLEKARDDIRVAVAQAYVEVLYASEILNVASQQALLDGELLDQMTERKLAGKASEADVAAQRATYAQSCYSEIQARGNLNMALLDLSQLLELPSPEGFDIVRPDVDDVELQLLTLPEVVYERALGLRPAVQAAEFSLESAKVSIDRAKGGYLPTLSLNGGIGSNYYTTSNVQMDGFGSQIRNNFSQYVGLSLNIPVFSRFSTRNAVRTAELNYTSRQLQLENVKKSLYKEIQQAYYNAVTSQAKFKGSAESSESARQNYELTEEKYRNGKASITDYNDARNSWLSAESNFLKSRYECIFQTKLLDFYQGGELIIGKN